MLRYRFGLWIVFLDPRALLDIFAYISRPIYLQSRQQTYKTEL